MSNPTGADPRVDPSSALYWFPNTAHRIPHPQTRFVEVPEGWMGMLNEAASPPRESQRKWNATVARIKAIGKVVGYPFFLRTDLASAKHDGPRAYKVEHPVGISAAMGATLEDNEMKWLSPAAFMVRQWLDLPAEFVAFHGHPIAREWRFFANANGVECSHPYWPESAIRFYHDAPPEPSDWRHRLRMLSQTPPPVEIAERAVLAAKLCRKAKSWSVDFAQDAVGVWWLIDMAVAEQSSHPWDGCSRPNNEPRSRPAAETEPMLVEV